MRDDIGYNRTVRDDIAAILFGDGSGSIPHFGAGDPTRWRHFVARYPLVAGGLLRVRRQNDRLILSAEGQNAIDRLSITDTKAHALLEKRNKHAFDYVTNACDGQLTGEEAEDWGANCAGMRPCGKLIVVGTVSGPTGEYTTSFVRVHDSGPNSVERRICFAKDQCYPLDGSPDAVMFLLQPLSESEFVGYDLFTRDTIELLFSTDAAAQGVMLRLRHGSSEEILAKR